jgi:glucosamine-6-phosphate deaminase
MPSYLSVPAAELGAGSGVAVRHSGDMQAVARQFADDLFQELVDARRRGGPTVFIVPVGPVDQYPLLAGMINDQRLDCREVLLINMDEYLTDADEWIPPDHPLSFRGHMQRKFYDLLDPSLAPVPANRLVPHPQRCGEIQRRIDERGGVDTCFGGIGINGHIAFNEPPVDESPLSDADFRALPTRNVDLDCRTRTINSVTVGGEISVIPRRAVTVGMKEILSARKLRFYCNRPWQSAVVRRVLHGPICADCPASFLRTHADAAITVADYVAQPPDIRLR